VQTVCLDLEGVLVPEIWIAFADRTGIPELRRTTRDEPDYDKLMRFRLELLRRHELGLPDIQKVIREMGPEPGAKEFLDALRTRYQVLILSDTYYEFAMPLMAQLGSNALLRRDRRAGRDELPPAHPRSEARVGPGARALNFKVIAAGDSYNDTAMLSADADPLPAATERRRRLSAVPGGARLPGAHRRDRGREPANRRVGALKRSPCRRAKAAIAVAREGRCA
jgi:phosphoserine/homoserine phosphotransferase